MADQVTHKIAQRIDANGRVFYIFEGAVIVRSGSEVPAEFVTGQLTNEQLAAIAASKVTGQLLSTQIAGVAAGVIEGSITSDQIASVAAATVTGLLTDAQIADLAAGKVTGQLVEQQIASVAALAVTGTLTADQIASVAAAVITGQLTDAQIADLAAAKVTGQLTDAQIADLAATKVTGQLTDAQIQALQAAKILGQIASGQIADGAVIADKIAVATLSAISADVGILTAGILRGPVVETSATDPKVRMDTTGIFVTDAFGSVPTRLDIEGLNMGTSGQFGTEHAVTWKDSTDVLRAGLWSRVDLMGNASLRAFAGNEEVTILLEDGRSDFLKIVGSAERKVEFGTATIQINNNAFGSVSVPHNLGVVPIHIDVTITSGNIQYYSGVSNPSSTSFTATATHKDGVNNTVTIQISWAAYS